MSPRNTRLRVPALLLGALSVLLVFAAVASAEVRTGESSSVTTIESPLPEATLVTASASYETTGGSLGVVATTEVVPSATVLHSELQASFFTTTSECSSATLKAGNFTYPLVAFEAFYFGLAPWVSVYFAEGEEENRFDAVKTLSGTATTLSFTSEELASRGFNCAVVSIEDLEGESVVAVPLTAPVIPPAPPAIPAPPATPPPPAPEAPARAPAPAAAPTPGPAVLSIAKPKPLKLKVGKSKTIKVKVTNTGGTATAPGTLRVKAVKGVLVRPETQKLPVLAPGAAWSVPVRLEVTATAKEESTLSLTGSASGVTAKGSLVLKRTE
jgi:hypothetical protein